VFLNQRPLSSAFLHQTVLPGPIHSDVPGNRRMHGAHFHGNEYDDATMKALIAHFKTFTAQEKR
jgi:hypothetical protein